MGRELTDWSKRLHPHHYPNTVDPDTFVRFAAEVGRARITRCATSRPVTQNDRSVLMVPGVTLFGSAESDEYTAQCRQWWDANEEGVVTMKGSVVEKLQKAGVRIEFVRRSGSLD